MTKADAAETGGWWVGLLGGFSLGLASGRPVSALLLGLVAGLVLFVATGMVSSWAAPGLWASERINSRWEMPIYFGLAWVYGAAQVGMILMLLAGIVGVVGLLGYLIYSGF